MLVLLLVLGFCFIMAALHYYFPDVMRAILFIVMLLALLGSAVQIIQYVLR